MQGRQRSDLGEKDIFKIYLLRFYVNTALSDREGLWGLKKLDECVRVWDEIGERIAIQDGEKSIACFD